jgi:hypothetical protein
MHLILAVTDLLLCLALQWHIPPPVSTSPSRKGHAGVSPKGNGNSSNGHSLSLLQQAAQQQQQQAEAQVTCILQLVWMLHVTAIAA